MQDRRQERVVDREKNFAIMRDFRRASDVGQFQRWVGRSLDKDQLGVGPDRRFDFDQLSRVDKRGFNTQIAEDFVYQPSRSAVDCFPGNDVVARRKDGQEQRGFGCQARGKTSGWQSIFQSTEQPF